jgi:hypothetical protein
MVLGGATKIAVTSHERQFLALNVSGGMAQFRQLPELFRKTYARREFFSP